MAAFAGKYLLFLVTCLAERALATKFGIIEPFPENIYPIEGTPAKVTCVAFDSDGEKTPERIQFMRKDQFARYTNITPTDNIFFTSETKEEDQGGKKLKKLSVTMHINNVSEADDSQFGPLGRYECHAFAVGDSEERKHGFSVNVIRKSEIPTVSVLKVGILPHGENVTISCNLTEGASGTGLKRISWYKDNKLVQSVRNPDPKNQQDSLGPLVITNVGVRDGGTYMCRLEVLLRNIKSFNVSDSTMIRIAAWLDKPKEDTELKTFKGDSVSFECAAKGFPLEVEFKVQKKGEDTVMPCINGSVGSDGKYAIHRNGIYDPYVLTVSDLQYTDRGFYYCCLPSNCSDNVEDDCQRFILRVRDPLGPLWPVIGILIEAIVLFLIIFIAEKRKKSKENADKQDGRVEFSFSSTDDGDRGQVRLRKVGENPVA